MNFRKSVNIKSLDKVKLMIVARDVSYSFFLLTEVFKNALKYFKWFATVAFNIYKLS
jgi:hypothetical protein